MNCPKCNAVIDDDSKFCVYCGASIEAEAASTVVESAAPASSTMQKLLQDKTKLIGLIVGTALIIVGIYRIMEAGTTISSTSFGADFYTYTYQGIVAISRILASIEVTVGWVIIAIGAAIDVISLR